MNAREGLIDEDAVSVLANSVKAAAAGRGGLVAPWNDLKTQVRELLESGDPSREWADRLAVLMTRLRQLAAQDVDVALYMMLQTAINEVSHYSANHAMYCTVVADLCTSWFEWPLAEVNALADAALTMNVGMTAVQDAMANQDGPPDVEQRRCIAQHPARSVDTLMRAGVSDALWLETVRRHHQPIGPGEGADASHASQRLALVLHRIDVFTAKLSRRKTRLGASATIAARDACLGDGGLPDATGATMLRVLGLYPPGSYVLLANGEVGVVTYRGAKAHTPVAAILARASGAIVNRPHLRDTSLAEFVVQRSLSPSEMKIGVVHQRVLSAQWA